MFLCRFLKFFCKIWKTFLDNSHKKTRLLYKKSASVTVSYKQPQKQTGKQNRYHILNQFPIQTNFLSKLISYQINFLSRLISMKTLTSLFLYNTRDGAEYTRAFSSLFSIYSPFASVPNSSIFVTISEAFFSSSPCSFTNQSRSCMVRKSWAS